MWLRTTVCPALFAATNLTYVRTSLDIDDKIIAMNVKFSRAEPGRKIAAMARRIEAAADVKCCLRDRELEPQGQRFMYGMTPNEFPTLIDQGF